MSAAAGVAAFEPNAAQKKVLDRVFWRVMPFVTACMVIGTIDRSNVGFAKLTMAHDLGMSEAVFALGASLFFIGYTAFEIPSALAVHRFGARRWFARTMFTWGLATLGLAFSNSATMFYVLRFLLGVAEAGLYPGLLYYITLWLPPSYHARGIGMLSIGSALGNGFGALVSGPLLDLHGALGFAGWQWIFLVTGAIPVIGTFVILAWMRDRIDEAKFLTAEEKADLSHVLQPGGPKHHGLGDILKAMANPLVLAHGLGYTTLLTALYGVIYWAPSVVKTFGVTGTQNGMLVFLPWLVDAVLLLLLPKIFRSRDNIRVLIGLLVIGSIAFAASVGIENHYFRYAMLVIGIPCISLALTFYWPFPARMFTGAAAAAALATINSIGNLGGLFGQNLMPALAEWGGSASYALIAPCVCLGVFALGAILVMVFGKRAPA